MVRPLQADRPALEQIAQELGGKVTIAKVNIEDSPTAPSRLACAESRP